MNRYSNTSLSCLRVSCGAALAAFDRTLKNRLEIQKLSAMQETMKKTKALLGRLESLKTVNEETGEGYITFASLQERKLPAGTCPESLETGIVFRPGWGAASTFPKPLSAIFRPECQLPLPL